MAIDRDPTSLAAQCEQLARSGELLTVSDHRLLQAATDQMRPLRLEDLTHQRLIQQALNDATALGIVTKAVTSPQLIEHIHSRLQGKLKGKKDSRHLVQRLAHQLINAIYKFIEQQPPRLDIRATALGAILQAIDNQEPTAESSLSLLEQHVRELASCPTERSEPRDYVELLTRTLTAAQLPPHSRTVAAGIVGTKIRDQMCRQWYGDDYDGYAVEEYRTVGLVYARDADVRLSSLNEPSMFDDVDTNWLRYAAKHEVPETGVDDYPTAVIDEHHPKHALARRLFRLFITATDPLEHLGFIEHMAAFGNDVTDVKDNRHLLAGLNQTATVERLQRYQQIYDEVYGEAGHGLLEKTRQAMLAGLSGVSVRDWRKQVPPIRPKNNFTFEHYKYSDELRPVYRAVEIITPADERIYRLFPEITAEQRVILETLCQALAADIKESTVALRSLGFKREQTLARILPLPDRFPAMQLILSNDDFRCELTCDEQLQIESASQQSPGADAQLVARAYLLAMVHDKLLVIQQVQYGERSAIVATETMPPAPTPPRPTRVHRVKNYLVIGERPEAEDEVTHTIHPTDQTNATLTVDRRPHWSDRAPQLTRQARQFALEQWLATVPETIQSSRSILTKALTQEYAHRLTIRRILESLFQVERLGKKLLPSDFPLQTAIDQLTQLTDERYQQLLNSYQGPLPNIYRMEKRLEADRRQLTELGVAPMSIPPRQRETETYMPFSRYQTPVKLNQRGVGKVKQYTVIRGENALEILERILH